MLFAPLAFLPQPAHGFGHFIDLNLCKKRENRCYLPIAR